MSAAEQLQQAVESRRQIFRIADPDFSSMRIELLAQGNYIECTCLDLSPLGVGVLAPRSAFGSLEPGTIVEYRLHFALLAPVDGVGLLANTTDTKVHSEDGSPLVRLGIRFSDPDTDLGGRADVQQRRSERFHLPTPFRPLCICNDPLWLGDLLSIAIFDISEHGISGLVSAKKTVIAEGLRTVFRIGFPHMGVAEVPVRVIYANPTEDTSVYRIGCEFVGHSENFLSAFRTYTAMHLMKSYSKAPDIAQNLLPAIRVITEKKELQAAEESFQTHVTELSSSNQVQIHTVYAKLTRPGKLGEHFFRFEVHTPFDMSKTSPESEEYIIGKQYFYVSLFDLVAISKDDLERFVAGLISLATIRHVHSLRFAISKDTELSLFDELQEIGLHVPDSFHDPLVREFRLSNLRLGLGIERRLWLRSFLPLAPFKPYLHGPDFEFGRGGNFLLKISAPLASFLLPGS